MPVVCVRRCVRGRACAQASCARDAHRVHRFDPFSSSIVQFVLPFQRLLFSLFSFQIRSFFTTISSLVPQEQDFSIYHSSVIPFEQRTLGFLFLRRNDDTDREIRERWLLRYGIRKVKIIYPKEKSISNFSKMTDRYFLFFIEERGGESETDTIVRRKITFNRWTALYNRRGVEDRRASSHVLSLSLSLTRSLIHSLFLSLPLFPLFAIPEWRSRLVTN